MKMSKILSLLLVLVMLVSCLASCGLFGGEQGSTGDGGEQGGEQGGEGGGDEQPTGTVVGNGNTVVKIWVSELAGATDLAAAQITEFLAANPSYNETYKFEISGVSEADAATQVLTDIALAPDVFCFAQDQLARLVQADALAVPGQQATANVKAANDPISISAASVAGTLYAYPLTSDNGYYMYYDKSVVSEDHVDDLAAIVADCEAAGKNICFELENAWYTASFFMATGCVNNWTMDENGKFTSVEDTYNSDAGIVAMKGMQIVTKSEYYVNSSSEFTNAGIVITGIWNANTAEENYGENLGVTDLPSFTVDNETYHLGSFSGNKLMGVKPQADAQKLAMLHKLAQHLTNTECQLERYEEFQWGPSNLEAQADEGVKANVSLAALALQNQYAIPQGNIHGSWWDIAKLLGAESKNAADEEGLQLALDTYQASIDALFEMTEEELRAWSAIGTICGTNWDTDFSMPEVSEGVYETDVLELTAGQEYKVRQGKNWDVNYGQDGVLGGSNIPVETSGNYKIRLTISGDSVTLELVPAN